MTEAKPPVENLKKSAWEGLIWGVGFTLTRDVLQFVTMIVLVRLLTPEVYGQMALAQSVIAVLAMVSFRTFGKYALQSRDPSRFDWKNHFSIGVFVNWILFFLVVTGSVLAFYFARQEVQTIALVIGIISVVFLLEPLGLGYTLFLQANHRWKPYRLLMLLSAVLSSGTGIWLAFEGAGVYALAFMIPAAQIPYLIMFFLRDHPLKFIKPRFADYKDGQKFAGLSAANTAFGAGTALVERSLFASMFGFATLGIYNRGLSLNQMTSARIGPVVIGTLYPVLTRADAESERFREFSRILVSGCIIVSFPICVFFAIRPEPIVTVLFGDTWRDVANYLPLIAFIAFFGQLTSVLNRILIANLRQAIALNVSIGAGVSRLIVIAVALPFGIDIFLMALLAQGFAVFVASLIVGQIVSAIRVAPILLLVATLGGAVLIGALALSNLPTPTGNTVDLIGQLIWQGLIYGVVVILIARLCMAQRLLEFVELLPGSTGRMTKRALVF